VIESGEHLESKEKNSEEADPGATESFQPTPWHALPEAFRSCAATTHNAVLLETAKQDGAHNKSLLFLNPVRELIAESDLDLEGLLREIDNHLANDLFLAGYFNYECGEHFVGLSSRLPADTRSSEPLAWLGVFTSAIEFDHTTGEIRGTLPTPDSADANICEDATIITDGLQISREDYGAALARIAQHLNAGDTYQVNFTDRVTGHTDAAPLAVYETLLRQQPVPFAALINRTEGPLLSFSPELFFRTTQGRIVVRPMKGTWRRGCDLAEDRQAAQHLRNDEKNRSEHVMIVDLLRNDLGRICRYGSVQVDELFAVEPYKTLLQMTSTCSGVLRDKLSPSQVFASLFPSGSITGAPKRRTMEIIQELEHHPRGIYTGAIGYFAPGGEACFNVAIRTVQLKNGQVTMGVGGGITAGSKPDEEFEECRLKATFLTQKRPPFALIETMHCNGKIALLPLHLQRLTASAQYFGIQYDEDRFLRELAAAVRSCGSTESKVRVELSETGTWQITAAPLESILWNGRLLLAEERTHSTDLFLRHKTTNREIYERSITTARQLGFDEVLFLNERSDLTEGAISNLLVLVNNTWMTPPLTSGVLPGVQRTHLLHSFPDVKECAINIEALQSVESLCVCNALRGIRPMLSIARADGTILWEARRTASPGDRLPPVQLR
jgi:para-aminobenzoate synthetase / 4-amino-4-deoxychorismate lyase